MSYLTWVPDRSSRPLEWNCAPRWRRKRNPAVQPQQTESESESPMLPRGHAVVDAEALDIHPRRGRLRRRAWSATSSEPPQRAPDLELDIPTLPQQALPYRLGGDRNPLHSDPEFASAAGFPKLILHGLCTYAMACKALTDALLDVPGRNAAGEHLEGSGRHLGNSSVPARDGAVALGDVEFVPARGRSDSATSASRATR
jgi:hypothetical protein